MRLRFLLFSLMMSLAFSIGIHAQTLVPRTDSISVLTQQKQELEALRAELLVKYTPDYFKIKELDEKIAAIDKEIAAVLLKKQAGVDLSPADADLLAKLLVQISLVQTCVYKTEAHCKSLNIELAELYSQVGKSPRLIRFMAAAAVNEYEQNRLNTRSAPQVSQIADEQNVELMRLIVIQNQRIIELLEQIVKKK